MNSYTITALVAVLLLPTVLVAQQPADAKNAAMDEIRVIGRTVTTDLAKVEVHEEMLVDTATVLKDIPGANLNANGPVTGIAQYRGMYGDRISVVVDKLGVVSGGPNAMDAPLSYVSPMITDELVVVRGIPSVSLANRSADMFLPACRAALSVLTRLPCQASQAAVIQVMATLQQPRDDSRWPVKDTNCRSPRNLTTATRSPPRSAKYAPRSCTVSALT